MEISKHEDFTVKVLWVLSLDLLCIGCEALINLVSFLESLLNKNFKNKNNVCLIRLFEGFHGQQLQLECMQDIYYLISVITTAVSSPYSPQEYYFTLLLMSVLPHKINYLFNVG